MNLEAYRLGRLADVAAHAARLDTESRTEADARRAAAQRSAAAVVERARADGAAEADREMTRDGARERRRARRIVLDARRRAYERLRVDVHAAIESTDRRSEYEALLDRLEGLAHEQLGDRARVERDPAGGGLIAEIDGRRVDYTLDALVERCLRGLGAEVERLWI